MHTRHYNANAATQYNMVKFLGNPILPCSHVVAEFYLLICNVFVWVCTLYVNAVWIVME